MEVTLNLSADTSRLGLNIEKQGENLMFEIVCIAMAIYFEARSEPLEGQVAVANTIMNRVHSPYFPDTPCEVVKQGRYWMGSPLRNQCHFSYWCDGKPETITDEDAYTQALSIAIHAERLYDVTEGSTYYHRDDVNPYWVDGLQTRRQIGRHIFYKE
jgi:spore germination cell wall hydrolase CwlJ-like protein